MPSETAIGIVAEVMLTFRSDLFTLSPTPWIRLFGNAAIHLTTTVLTLTTRRRPGETKHVSPASSRPICLNSRLPTKRGIAVIVKELREKRVGLIKEIRAILAKEGVDGYAWTAEDTQEVDRLESDLFALEARMARAEKDAGFEATLGELDTPDQRKAKIGREDFDGGKDTEDRSHDEPTYKDNALALAAFLRGGRRNFTDEQRAACRRLGFDPTQTDITVQLAQDGFLGELQNEYRERSVEGARSYAQQRASERLRVEREQRTMGTVSGPAGGFAVPMSFMNRFEQNMLAYSGMMQVAEVMRTEGGEQIEMLTGDDTGNTGEIVGESADNDGSTDPTLGTITWFAYKFSSKMVKMPFELLQDNAYNLADRVGGWLGERLGRIKEQYFTTGTGVKQPRGCVTAATLGVSAASATAITIDEVFDLEAALDPAYAGTARYMCHRLVAHYLRKKKNGEGDYIWQPNVQAGRPDTINGRPVTYNTCMASTIATGNKTLLFGDLSKYLIREAGTLRLVRLNERYAEKDQVAFIAFQRCDGNLVDAGTPPIVYLQQA